MPEIEVIIRNPAGLHLRPASLFVQRASQFTSDIKARNISKGSSYQNAKSAIGVMLLRVAAGETIGLQAEGADAEAALAALAALIESNFDGA